MIIAVFCRLNQLNMDDEECLPESNVTEAEEQTREVQTRERETRPFRPAAQIA